jgi:hypothetical protein
MTEQEKREYFKFERDSQRIIDEYYVGRGHTVDRSTSCMSYDCILDGKYKVEEKIRQIERSDILVEFIQDAVTYAPGWFYETKCDYLHYVFMNDTGGAISRFVRLNWGKFKYWCLTEYLKKNKHPYSVISDKGWGITVNFSIPINAIPNYAITYDDKLGGSNG